MATATLKNAIDALDKLGCQPRQYRDQYTAFCPIHEADAKGHKPSLNLREGDKQSLLIHCHAGCDGREIFKVLGLQATVRLSKEPVAVYSYRDAEGHEVRQKVRFEPKDFRIRYRGVTGQWVYKAGNSPPVLYRLPELQAAIAEGQTIFVVEGEKDADKLASLGLEATTNIEGAAQPKQRAKWKPEYTDQLAGAVRVVLLPDNDEPGRAHMSHLAKVLANKGIDVRIAELSGLPEKGDVSDWLNAGHTAEELERLANDAPKTTVVNQPEADQSAQKPIIHVCPGKGPWMTDDAERWLIQRDDGIFQRGDCLVRWTISKQETVHGLHRPEGVAIIKPIDVEHLLDRMEKHIDWRRPDRRTKADVPTNAPRDVALKLLSRHGLWSFPVLVGVITTPTLRPDGSILDKPGYDERTGLLYVERQPFPYIPEMPSHHEARQALDFIFNEVLAGFPFVELYHRAAALSAIVSVVVRHTLRHVPLHAFTAPKAGSGKSLLADCIALIGTGRPSAVLSLCEDQGEMNKAITSLLMQGDAVVNLDNIERGETLAGREISKALTQEIYSGRILGMTKVVHLASSCLWLATGNQLQVSGDMTRRVIPCEIDPECERPDEREFTRDLYEWIPKHRPELVKAALTVLRAYVVAGKPRQAIKPLGGFEDWSNLVRSALIWLGEADPLTGRDSIEEADPERSKLKSLLIAWHHTFGSSPTTCKAAVYKATPRFDPENREEMIEAPELREVLVEFFKDRSGNPSSRTLGEYIRQNVRRIEAGSRFEAAGITHSARLWKVVITNQKFFERALGESGELGESFSKHARDFAVSKENRRIEGMQKTVTDRRLTPLTPLTPPNTPLPPVNPPLTVDENQALAILATLYQHHAANLKAGGLDPKGAKVTTRDFIKELEQQGIPFESTKALLRTGKAITNGYYWNLTL